MFTDMFTLCLLFKTLSLFGRVFVKQGLNLIALKTLTILKSLIQTDYLMAKVLVSTQPLAHIGHHFWLLAPPSSIFSFYIILCILLVKEFSITVETSFGVLKLNMALLKQFPKPNIDFQYINAMFLIFNILTLALSFLHHTPYQSHWVCILFIT